MDFKDVKIFMHFETREAKFRFWNALKKESEAFSPMYTDIISFIIRVPRTAYTCGYINYIEETVNATNEDLFKEYQISDVKNAISLKYDEAYNIYIKKKETNENMEKYKDIKVILELPDGKASVEFWEIGKKEIQHFNNDDRPYSYWFILRALEGEGKGAIYSRLYKIFGDLIKDKYYLKNTEVIYGGFETYRFEFERRNEMKNMFFDNFTEPIFADYEPIKGYHVFEAPKNNVAPKITLRDFYFEPSDGPYPSVQMKFNISPGVITEDSQFAIRRYLTDLDNKDFYCLGVRSRLFKETLNGGYTKKAPLTFKLYSGVERASQRYKTICHWEDGVKTTIYRDKPINGGPVARAFAWCYVKRTFGTVSHFKKHVDKRTTKIGGVIYFEGDCLQDDYAQASVGQDWIQYDIYDAAALAITAKRYGGLKNLNENYIQKALEIDADLRSAEGGFEVISEKEVLNDTKKKKSKKSNK